MVATLQSRKEALEAKILEKNEELKKLCLQEADLTGVIPPEIPLEPGEPPPPIRRRIGTSFSFPQNLINNVKDADDESLTALELECRVQLNIAEAALALANDSSANKAARRKHRLMYRQSQRRLMELETRLNLLKQGKAQVKKKPRPNTTAVESINYLKEQNKESLGSWHGNTKATMSLDDCDKLREFNRQNELFASLQRSFKSNTSQGSNSPKTDISGDDYKAGFYPINNNASIQNNLLSSSVFCPNVATCDFNQPSLNANAQNFKKINKKATFKRQWDTQSAGGTLLPGQTYPEHSHLPYLNRTQSLGSVESNTQKSKDSWSIQDLSTEDNVGKEKEWYETSLDSAPSPPLRTTSKLPTMARMLYQMQEMQTQEGGVTNINSLHHSASHPVLSAAQNTILKYLVKNTPGCTAENSKAKEIDGILNSIQQLQLNPNKKGKILNMLVDEFGLLNSNDILHNGAYNESYSYPTNVSKTKNFYEQSKKEVQKKLDASYPSTSNDSKYSDNSSSEVGLPISRQNSVTQMKLKANNHNENSLLPQENSQLPNANTSANISVENTDSPVKNWFYENDYNSHIRSGNIAVPQESVSKPHVPTQPYYHILKHTAEDKIKNLQYQAAKNRYSCLTEEQVNNKPSSPLIGTHHPPHAISQNEISFDTVVPFESPQNHMVVQAGKWQPYREVTKPFEMSDFYKYSTKFRQTQVQATRANTPDTVTNSPNTFHQKGMYMPLKPMTCRPVESKSNAVLISNQMDIQCNESDKNLVEVSPPEIV